MTKWLNRWFGGDCIGYARGWVIVRSFVRFVRGRVISQTKIHVREILAEVAIVVCVPGYSGINECFVAVCYSEAKKKNDVGTSVDIATWKIVVFQITLIRARPTVIVI